MNKVIIYSCILLFGFSLEAEPAWEFIDEKEGIQVFNRSVSGSPLKSVKGIVLIPAPIDKVLAVLEDVSKTPRWLYNSRHASTLKQINIVERVDYIITNMPWPVWDRDVIIRSVFQQNRLTKQVEIKFSSEPNWVALRPGIVRVRKMTGRMLLTPQGKNGVQVLYEVSADPAGKLPKWLVNDMSFDFPFLSLKRLREVVKATK